MAPKKPLESGGTKRVGQASAQADHVLSGKKPKHEEKGSVAAKAAAEAVGPAAKAAGPAAKAAGPAAKAAGPAKVGPAAKADGPAAKAAGLAAEGAADDAEQAGIAQVCTGAADVLQRYSLGVQRIPLEKLGASPINRKVSGRHVHRIGRRIISVEGFQRYRYKYGWCHQWNPADPLSVARHTNELAKVDPLLARVPEVPLYGSFAKTHLMSFLHALRSGSVYWQDSGELMMPPEGAAVLREHLEQGMFYEVLSWEAVEKDEADVRALMASDNFDAGFALGQTEIALLQSIHEGMKIVRPPRGMTQFDTIVLAVERNCGQRWNEEEIASLYNFDKVVGDVHLAFLVLFTNLAVDFDVMAIKPQDFNSVSKMHPTLPWLKIAVLAVQYTCPLERCSPGPHGTHFGNLIGKADFDKLAKADITALAKVEKFVKHCMETYVVKAMPEVSEETHAREMSAFVTRVGKALILSKDVVQDPPNLAKVESKLRSQLKTTNLPPPVLDLSGLDNGESCVKKSGASCSTTKGKVEVDSTPGLVFEGQEIVADNVVKARQLNLLVGARVVCCREARGIRKGALGRISEIGRDILVMWDKGSCLDGQDADVPLAEAVALTMTQVQPHEDAPAKAAEKKKIVEVVLPEGIAWSARHSKYSKTSLESLIVASLQHLYATRSATADLLLITDEEKPRLMASQDIRARRLFLIPFIVRLGEACKRNKKKQQITVTANGAEETFAVIQPDEEEDVLVTEAGETRVLYPFQLIGKSSKDDESAVTLLENYTEVTVPLMSYYCRDPLMKASGGGKAPLVTVKVPYYVNEQDIAKGATLRV